MAAGFKTAQVAAGDVPATLTDYPTYVDLTRMNGGTALSLAEAQSIRVYADSGKTTEWAREIVSATEMHVKVPSLTSTTSIYVDWDGVRADYAVTDTYGRNAVWSNYVAVWHKGGGTDSVGAHDTTNVGVTVGGYASPYYGSATSFTANGHICYAAAHSDFRAIDTEGGYQYWSKVFALPTTYEYNHYMGMYGVGNTGNNNNLVLERAFGGNNPSYVARSTFLEATTPTINVWDKMTFTINATNIDGYKNGSLNVTKSSGAVVASGGEFTIGNHTSSGSSDAFLNGAMWEVRLPKFYITANWETTEYNNQSDEAGFWGTWSTVVGGGGNTTNFFALMA